MPIPLNREAIRVSTILTSLFALTACATVPSNIRNPVFLKNDISDRQIGEKAKEPKPIVRIPPILPLDFINGSYSGKCGLVFDITASGMPTNIEAQYCTHDALESSAIKSVSKWKYAGRAGGGNDIIFYGSKTAITFLITDTSGSPLPMANKALIPAKEP